MDATVGIPPASPRRRRSSGRQPAGPAGRRALLRLRRRILPAATGYAGPAAPRHRDFRPDHRAGNRLQLHREPPAVAAGPRGAVRRGARRVPRPSGCPGRGRLRGCRSDQDARIGMPVEHRLRTGPRRRRDPELPCRPARPTGGAGPDGHRTLRTPRGHLRRRAVRHRPPGSTVPASSSRSTRSWPPSPTPGSPSTTSTGWPCFPAAARRTCPATRTATSTRSRTRSYHDLLAAGPRRGHVPAVLRRRPGRRDRAGPPRRHLAHGQGRQRSAERRRPPGVRLHHTASRRSARVAAAGGALSPVVQIAPYATRYMHEYGVTREQLAWIPVTQRAHAARNPDAVYRAPLSVEDYLSARMISTPICLYDCDVPPTARRRSWCPPPRRRPTCGRRWHRGHGGRGRGRPSWEQWEDLGRVGYGDRRAMWAAPTCALPTSTPPSSTTASPSRPSGGSRRSASADRRGRRLRRGGSRIALGGELPLNTWGGQLSGGRLHARSATLPRRSASCAARPGSVRCGAPRSGRQRMSAAYEAGAAVLTRWYPRISQSSEEGTIHDGATSQVGSRARWPSSPAPDPPRARASAPVRRPRWRWPARVPASCSRPPPGAGRADPAADPRVEGGSAQVFAGDVTKAAEASAMVRAAVDTFGTLDILVNNIGLASLGTVVDLPRKRGTGPSTSTCAPLPRVEVRGAGHGRQGRRLDRQHLLHLRAARRRHRRLLRGQGRADRHDGGHGLRRTAGRASGSTRSPPATSPRRWCCRSARPDRGRSS